MTPRIPAGPTRRLVAVEDADSWRPASFLAQFGVEHRVSRLLDRRVRELDREHRVVRSVLGAPLGASTSCSPAWCECRREPIGDVLVPRALQE